MTVPGQFVPNLLILGRKNTELTIFSMKWPEYQVK